MIELQKIFNIDNGNKFDLNKMIRNESGINFIGRTAKNNGATAIVEEIANVTPYSSGCITVALGGSVLSSFLQPKAFYTGQNIAVLKAKKSMTEAEKLFYCLSIQCNAYRFSTCGREANRFLRSLLVPAPSEIPKWVKQTNIHDYENARAAISKNPVPSLDTTRWKIFSYSDLFDIRKGTRLTNADMKHGTTSFVGATDSNNGITNYIDKTAVHPKNCLTVSYNGSIAEAFYQPTPFCASDDINVLYPKFALNPFIAMFMCTLITKEKFRYNYGRKWNKSRMESSTIKLPVSPSGQPDWKFIESYIKTLPYTSSLEDKYKD